MALLATWHDLRHVFRVFIVSHEYLKAIIQVPPRDENVTCLDREHFAACFAQSLEVFKTLEQKAVFVPMGVVFLYNLLQVRMLAAV